MMKYLVPLFHSNDDQFLCERFQKGFGLMKITYGRFVISWRPQKSEIEFEPIAFLTKRLRSTRNASSDSDLKKFISGLNQLCSSRDSGDLYALWRESCEIDCVFVGTDCGTKTVAGFDEDGWSKEELFKKFQVYATASVLEFLQPAGIRWKGGTPDKEQMDDVAKLIGQFPTAPEGAKKLAVRELLEGQPLESVIKKLDPRHVGKYPPEALQLVKENPNLKTREIIERYSAELARCFGRSFSPSSAKDVRAIQRLVKKARYSEQPQQ